MKEYQSYTDVMYLLTGYLISDTDEPRYPQFDVFINENILFHTLEEAERKIAELAQEEELMNERACFFVYEVPVGAKCYPAQGQKIRSYTADGELNSESKVSALEDCNGTLELFPGREEAKAEYDRWKYTKPDVKGFVNDADWHIKEANRALENGDIGAYNDHMSSAEMCSR